MVFTKVEFQRIVVKVVLWLPPFSSIANKASLVLRSAVHIKLVVAVESLATESAQWVTPKAALIYRSWIVISFLHVPFQFLIREQLMLVCKDFLVPRAEITHFLVMYTPDVAMQVGPA